MLDTSRFPQENKNQRNNNFYKILSFSHVLYYCIELFYVTTGEKGDSFFTYLLDIFLMRVFFIRIPEDCRSQWPRGLRRRSAAARLLGLWIRIPPGAWMFFCCDYCVLSDRGLCDGLITRPEESYRMWCIVVCDLETSSRMRRPWPVLGCSAI